MIIEPLAIEGAWRIRLEPITDERGFFARTFCSAEFTEHGLPAMFEQSSLSRNARAGTLRGLHYHNPPFAEAKLVRCVRGAIQDVVVDIRRDSPTYGQWIAEHLDAEQGTALFIGAGLAHGFQTLCNDTDVLYQISPAFVPGHGQGLRWNDPAFRISWPAEKPILSDRDGSYPDWVQ